MSIAYRQVIRGAQDDSVDDATHTHLQVFAGPEPGQRALTGELVMRRDEAAEWMESVPFPRLPALTHEPPGPPVDPRGLIKDLLSAYDALIEARVSEPEPGTVEWQRWRERIWQPISLAYSRTRALAMERLP